MSYAVYIWDLPLRLFHWLLAITLVAGYVTGKQDGLWLDWHACCGLSAIWLLVFRIVWGFMGSTYARFADFFPTPNRLKNYFSSEGYGLGHNPLGAISIFSLIGVILAQAGTGLFALEDEIEFYGPLYKLVSSTWSERLTSWHIQLVNVLIFLIGLHLSAVAYYFLIKRKNLISPMLTGKVIVAQNYPAKAVNGGGITRFILAVVISCFVLWCITGGVIVK